MCPVTYCMAVAHRPCLCGPAHGAMPCGPAPYRPLRPSGTDARVIVKREKRRKERKKDRRKCLSEVYMCWYRCGVSHRHFNYGRPWRACGVMLPLPAAGWLWFFGFWFS